MKTSQRRISSNLREDKPILSKVHHVLYLQPLFAVTANKSHRRNLWSLPSRQSYRKYNHYASVIQK